PPYGDGSGSRSRQSPYETLALDPILTDGGSVQRAESRPLSEPQAVRLGVDVRAFTQTRQAGAQFLTDQIVENFSHLLVQIRWRAIQDFHGLAGLVEHEHRRDSGDVAEHLRGRRIGDCPSEIFA